MAKQLDDGRRKQDDLSGRPESHPLAGRARAKGEEMTRKRDNHPSNKGYFIFAGGCALAAIVLVALLIHGEVQGPRVAPDIQPKTKILD
jgi:hypothetical protein